MRFLREKVGLVAFLFLVVSMALYGGSVQAYYGVGSVAGSGAYDGSVSYGGAGLYGGLYGSSMYGGLMGGMYGGMYGSSMYGGLMGGMYGGMYGSSMYGGLYGLGRLGLGEDMEQMRNAQLLLLPGLSLTSFFPTSSTTTAVPALPNPTGTWNGTYLSYVTLKGGIATFALTYNTLTLTVSGTAGLLLNKLIPIPIPVSGLNSATGFTLTGTYFDILKLKLYYASYSCTLVAPGYMTGTYIIHDALYLETDTGNFNLSLVI